MKLIAALLAAFLCLIAPAAAQWQVTNHAVPIGNGPGVVGFSAATTGTAGRLFIDQGVGSDPIFVVISGDCTITSGGVLDCPGFGTGTVTDVSVVTANGFSGTVATSTTTPAITMATTVTGILSGNGTAISAASTTGSGSVVLATSPTLVTPILGAASGTSLNLSGLTASSALATDGSKNLVSVTNTGTGNNVLATSPTVSGLTVTGSFTATGLVGNASLTNPATTVNGQTCTLGASCTVTAAATSITVGTTTVASGTDTRVLFDNAGTLGEYVISGTGNVAMTTSPTFTTPALGTPSALVGTNITGTAAGLTAGTVTTNANLTGPITSTGNATAVASQTGTGSTFVMNTSPTLVTPTLGVASASSVAVTGSSPPANGIYLPGASTLGLAANSNGEVQLTDTAMSPVADGGNSLGTTALGWQNLFGNTGYVWNIENGNWIATHTSGILTVGTGDLRVTSAGTNTASTVTVGGTQTFTNKTYDTAGTGNSFSINGVAVTANTGTGSVVRATSPTLVTPTLGVASATSISFGDEALAFYDEGTWVPTMSFATVGTSTWTYATQAGVYRRIGNLMFATVNMDATPTIGTGSGVVSINGLPVAAGTSVACAVRNMDADWTWPASRTTVQGGVSSGATTITISGMGTATSTTIFTAAHMTTGASHTVLVTCMYPI